MKLELQRCTLAAASAILLAPTASADLTAWLSAVAAGTTASFVDSAVPVPMNADIGLTNGTNGVTYEFVVNGTNAGVSSGLLGVRGTGVGDPTGLKFEQWPDSMQYGVTEFGVVDLYYGGSNTENTDVHLAFVADTVAGTTELFVDGISVGTVPSAPILQGMQGLGQIHDPNTGDFDVWTGTMHGVAVYESMLSLAEITAHRDAYFSSGIGTNYCGPAAINSTGVRGKITGSGSSTASNNDVMLHANCLPPNQFGYPLVSLTQGFSAMPSGSQGNLCLAGSIGRYTALAIASSPAGEIWTIIPPNLPMPPGGTITAGLTLNFQFWYRDLNPGATSNFTDGLSITFN